MLCYVVRAPQWPQFYKFQKHLGVFLRYACKTRLLARTHGGGV
jgi:hypothetical protein